MSISIGSGFSNPFSYGNDLQNITQTPYEKKLEEQRKEDMGIKDPAKEALDKYKKRHGVGEECETCKNRKYKDGSDEMVSFKSAQHIPRAAVASRVRAHEQEHVSNAYKDAEMHDGKVIRASVAIHTAICPECGRTYVSGGTTTTQIKYYNEDNQYQKDLKLQDSTKYAGKNVDYGC